MIEPAYRTAEAMGIAGWCQDEAEPFQPTPYAAPSWQPEKHPQKQSHEYIRNGTAKLVTLLHPSDGRVRVKGVESTTNVVLHSWLKQQLIEIVNALPQISYSSCPDVIRQMRQSWREGLTGDVQLLSNA